MSRRLIHAFLLGCLIVLFLWASWNPPTSTPGGTTGTLLNDLDDALFGCMHERPNFLSALPREPLSLAQVNAFITAELLDGSLDRQVLEERKLLHCSDSTPGPVLVDAWGNPIVLHVPSLYRGGLPYRDGSSTAPIVPLETCIWPPESGPVQIWSLGRNGVDDRGKGDDLLPQRVRAVPAPPGTRAGDGGRGARCAPTSTP